MTVSLSQIEGSLLDLPFPRLLFKIWQKEGSGSLHLRKGEEDMTLYFDKGRAVVEKQSLSEKDFLSALVKKRILPAEKARQCDRYAGAHMISRIRALSDLGLISPLPLWNLMESFFVRRLFTFFDWPEGRFVFEPGLSLAGGERLGLLQTHELILQGVRQMKDARLIERNLPSDADPIYISTPYFLHLLSLEPHERYALDVLHHAANLRSFYDRCEMGKRAAQKTLFAFVCLDILAAPEAKESARPAADPPAGDPAKVLAALNEKCAYIHKYITKQIGPLAHTILGNCVEEVKPALGPLFQKMKLLPDGRIEVDAAVSATAGHLADEIFNGLVKGYGEILTAEVLALKKSLGGAHETAVVKSLERVGCP